MCRGSASAQMATDATKNATINVLLVMMLSKLAQNTTDLRNKPKADMARSPARNSRADPIRIAKSEDEKACVCLRSFVCHSSINCARPWCRGLILWFPKQFPCHVASAEQTVKKSHFACTSIWHAEATQLGCFHHHPFRVSNSFAVSRKTMYVVRRSRSSPHRKQIRGSFNR